MIGQVLGHYRIESKLGEGGMGVVYRAIDTHLDRPVAVKILTAEAVADPERKKRFVQEARAASALNHPSIVHIYDIDSANGVDFIAMEYVVGATLQALIYAKSPGRPGGLPLGDVLNFAVHIADALSKAHAAGIVHRDLKPANIMVSDDGLVKILDFGLAKLAETFESETTLTMQGPHTEEGTIVGTPAYMSPEQVQGQRVDGRSDIFSFGAMVYEMLSGERPFQGAGKIEILSAVLHQEPKPLRELMAGLPREVERIVALALRKDLGRRFQHMADVKVALLALKEDAESGSLSALPAAAPVAPAWSPRRLALGLGAGLVVALGIAAAGIWRWDPWLRAPEEAPEVRLTRLTADSGLAAFPAISSDGKLLAYASDRAGDGNLDIWLQQIEGGEAIRLTRHESHDYAPQFSPDGARILFRSDRNGGGIYLIPSLGGDEQLIAGKAHIGRFSPDGKQIAFAVGSPLFASEIYVVEAAYSVAGRQPRRLQPDFFLAFFPLWTPDGKHVLFLGKRDEQDRPDWWVTSADAPGPMPVQTGALDVINSDGLAGYWSSTFAPGSWTADGTQVVFSARSGDSVNVWSLPLSPHNWQATGTPRRLTSGTGLELQPSVAAGLRGSTRLVFANLLLDNALWSVPLQADEGKVQGEMQRLTRGASSAIWPDLSEDGKRLVYNTYRAGNWDIWMQDLESGRQTSLASSAASELWPRITPDGLMVAYLHRQEQAIYAIRIGGTAAEKLCDECGEPWSWSPDHKKLLYRWAEPRRIFLLDLASGKKIELLQHATDGVTTARLSPDTRWIAFGKSGLPYEQVLIAPFRQGTIPESEWTPVTDAAGRSYDPRWSPDGKLLYFRSDRDGYRCVWAQRLEAASKRPMGPPFAVYHVHRERRYPLTVADIVPLGLSVARDKLVFAMGDLTGDIWMAEIAGDNDRR